MDLPVPIVQEIVIDQQQVAAKHLAEMSPEALDLDWKLDEFFGGVYVINLPQAQQRLLEITQTLNNIGLQTFNVFSAVDGRKVVPIAIWKKFKFNWLGHDLKTPIGKARFDYQRKGQAGCYLSHYRLIQSVKRHFDAAMQELKVAQADGDAKQVDVALKKVRRYSTVLILEDDCGFGIIDSDNTVLLTGCGTILRKAMQELPKDWDALYFTILSRKPPQPYSEHLSRIDNTYGNHAYVLKYTMYDAIINHAKKIEDPAVTKVQAFDIERSSVFPGRNVFGLVPALAYQRPGNSYITNVNRSSPCQYLLK